MSMAFRCKRHKLTVKEEVFLYGGWITALGNRMGSLCICSAGTLTSKLVFTRSLVPHIDVLKRQTDFGQTSDMDAVFRSEFTATTFGSDHFRLAMDRGRTGSILLS